MTRIAIVEDNKVIRESLMEFVRADSECECVFACATAEEALGGGEDYELVFAAGDVGVVMNVFESAGLRPPLVIGACVADPATRRLKDRPLEAAGWEHQLR